MGAVNEQGSGCEWWPRRMLLNRAHPAGEQGCVSHPVQPSPIHLGLQTSEPQSHTAGTTGGVSRNYSVHGLQPQADMRDRHRQQLQKDRCTLRCAGREHSLHLPERRGVVA